MKRFLAIAFVIGAVSVGVARGQGPGKSTN